MLNIHKSQSEYELFTALCIVGNSDLAGIYEYLTSSRGSCCKNESIIIVISGNFVFFMKTTIGWCLKGQRSTVYKRAENVGPYTYLVKRYISLTISDISLALCTICPSVATSGCNSFPDVIRFTSDINLKIFSCSCCFF